MLRAHNIVSRGKNTALIIMYRLHDNDGEFLKNANKQICQKTKNVWASSVTKGHPANLVPSDRRIMAVQDGMQDWLPHPGQLKLKCLTLTIFNVQTSVMFVFNGCSSKYPQNSLILNGSTRCRESHRKHIFVNIVCLYFFTATDKLKNRTDVSQAKGACRIDRWIFRRKVHLVASLAAQLGTQVVPCKLHEALPR